MKKLEKIIVVNGEDWKLNIFVEKRNSVRASFVNHGINIRLPKHLSIAEQNKAGKELLDWAVEKIKSEPEKYRERVYNDGDELNSFGHKYFIQIERHLKSKNSTKENDGNILFKIAEHYTDEEMQEYMKKQIRKILTKNHYDELVEQVHLINNHYFKKKVGEVSIKHTTSRWGQCHIRSHDIDFSTRLLLAPLPVIRYVIIHELAHLIYPDHSKRFWNEVFKVDPNYKDKIRWLKKFGHTLNL